MVKEESSIQISSQIMKQLAEMPKPSTAESVTNKAPDSDKKLEKREELAGSPEAADLQILNGVGDFDIDEDFIKMIESELEGGSHLEEHDIESGRNGSSVTHHSHAIIFFLGINGCY